MADSLAIPIVGGEGETWKNQVLAKIQAGENDQIVLPLYGSEAHITKPRK
jgi:tRNA threonylcarbamoyladenosine biosynthesis protein TsaB